MGKKEKEVCVCGQVTILNYLEGRFPLSAVQWLLQSKKITEGKSLGQTHNAVRYLGGKPICARTHEPREYACVKMDHVTCVFLPQGWHASQGHRHLVHLPAQPLTMTVRNLCILPLYPEDPGTLDAIIK